MSTTNQTHTRQGNYERVSTGIPVVHGYPPPQPNPAAQPPPPNTAARQPPRNPAAAHVPPRNPAAQPPPPNPAARQPPPAVASAGTPAPPFVKYVVVLVPLIYLTFLCATFSFAIENPPSFGIDWASVSLEENSGGVKANWEIGLAVQNTNTYKSYKFQEFNVWIMCASGYWSEIVVPPFHQRPKNTTLISATVNTSLPIYGSPQLQQGMMLDFHAKFRVRDASNTTLLATCGNLKVVFPSNTTKAIMVGGPRVCRSDKVESDEF